MSRPALPASPWTRSGSVPLPRGGRGPHGSGTPSASVGIDPSRHARQEESVPARGAAVVDPDRTRIHHLDVLDGWRGLSIVFVLLAHLFPLGIIGNTSVGILGMVVFFTLSGFLITSFLLKKEATLRAFIIRRFVRIIPLAWLYMSVVFLFQKESVDSLLAHFLFYANVPPPHVRLATDHLWSLCVEMQFYVGIAILFSILRVRGLYLLPVIGVAFTLFRVWSGVYASSISWFRIDEILAGCTLALLYRGRFGNVGESVLRWLATVPQWPFVLLLLVSCRYESGASEALQWLNYLRPYFGAILIGATLCNPGGRLGRSLDRPVLKYLASISYALYVLHVGLSLTWLGSGDLVEKYAKRPLLLLVLLLLAHLSTKYYEQPFIALGKRFGNRFARATVP